MFASAYKFSQKFTRCVPLKVNAAPEVYSRCTFSYTQEDVWFTRTQGRMVFYYNFTQKYLILGYLIVSRLLQHMFVIVSLKGNLNVHIHGIAIFPILYSYVFVKVVKEK